MPSASDLERYLIARLEAAASTLGGMAVYGLTTTTLLQMETALASAGGGIAVLPKSSPEQNANLGKPAAGFTFEVMIRMNPASPPMHLGDAAQAAQAALFGQSAVSRDGVALTGSVLSIGAVDYAIMEGRDRQPVLAASFPVTVQYSRQ